ncbi:hypothetical protein P8C59_005584 [Phyllachora maydis]|uniref:Uncharacterized protein n=1 Tax=Phyllachora maydis TaxID=1825666 RepID=A0AAD9I5W5_9PEZI|nr:hypothetical protein P8C59_005584 [Phyllachora maydis]
MPLWGKKAMARQTSKARKDADPADANPVDAPADKPVPDPRQPPQRPGTSGTEMALVTNRQQASQRLAQAQQAERSYRARKRAAAGRAHWAEAKQHLAEGTRHLRAACRLGASAVASVRYMASEKLDRRRRHVADVKRKRVAEKRRRLEERLAREAAARGSFETVPRAAEGADEGADEVAKADA